MSRDFYLRLLTLFFTMLSISFIVASVLIFPAYLLSLVEKNVADTKLGSQESQPVSLPDQNTLTVVKDLNYKLSLIENIEKDKSIFSQNVINEIILKKVSNIKITEISYQNDPQKGKQINISGTAGNREILLSFRKALEDSVSFSKVDLPVSNFIKGSNIKFYLSLIPS